jgi:FAD/FMN-containing dehydrogenase
MEPGMTAANEAQLALLANALAPYRSGAYANFVERTTDASSFYPDDTYARLRRLKGEYDPDRVFRANHEIA